MRGFRRGRGLGWLIIVVSGLSVLCLAHQLPAWLLAAGSYRPIGSPGPIPSGGPTASIPEPSFTVAPTWALEAAPTATESPMEAAGPVTLTILYDNNTFDVRLQAAWGFACLVEVGERTVLFDTGGDGSILMQNMAILGVDPTAIDAVVLSHNHADHIRGLEAMLDSYDQLMVYVPESFAGEFGRQMGERARIVPVTGPMDILEGVRTTGEMGAAIVEQSLVVETARGLAVVTGCAHPGIVEIVRRAASEGEIDLVIGGFHLSDSSRGDVQAVIDGLLALGVRRIAPCHCTGAGATGAIEEAFGAGFVQCGVGAVITIEP